MNFLVKILIFSTMINLANANDLVRAHKKIFDSFKPSNFDELEKPIKNGFHKQYNLMLSGPYLKSPTIQQVIIGFSKVVESIYNKNFEDISSNEIQTALQHLLKKTPDTKKPIELKMLSIANAIQKIYLKSIYSEEFTYQLSGAKKQPIHYSTLSNITLNNRPSTLPKIIEKSRTPLKYSIEKKPKIIVKNKNEDIDYIIVGSGSSGSIIASDLQSKGYTVILIEKGPFWKPGAYESRMIGAFREGGGSFSTLDQSISILTGKTLGGGSSVNGDVAVSPSHEMILPYFLNWYEQGKTPWNLDTIEKSSKLIDDLFETRQVKLEEFSHRNTNNYLLYKGALELGMEPHLYYRNDFVTQSKNRPFAISTKKTMYELFLEEALFPANKNTIPLTILSDAEVTRIEMEGNKAKGVTVKINKPWKFNKQDVGIIEDYNNFKIPVGTEVTINAKNVILSAGALGSPVILQKSAEKMKNESPLKNPLIGKGLVIHPVTYVTGIFPKGTNIDMNIADGSQSHVHVEAWSNPNVPENKNKQNYLILTGQFKPEGVAPTFTGSPNQVFEWAQNYRDSLTLLLGVIDKQNDSNMITKNGIIYKLGTEESERLVQATIDSIKILLQAGAQKVYLHTQDSYIEDENDKNKHVSTITPHNFHKLKKSLLKYRQNHSFLAGFHHQGTLRMGKSPKNSVVNHDFKVWGTNNLYVVDSSIFPGSVGSHPMQSIYFIAKEFTKKVLKKDN